MSEIRPILTILKTSHVSPKTLRKIEDAGYLVVRVDTHDDLRAVEVLAVASPMLEHVAAMETILAVPQRQTDFGKIVATKILDALRKQHPDA